MTRPYFYIRIDSEPGKGEPLSPETVRMGDLAAVMTAVEKVVAAGVDPNAITKGEVLVSLVGVEAGSDRLRVALAKVALSSLLSMASALAERRVTGLSAPVHKALVELDESVRSKAWTLAFEPTDSVPVARAVISATAPVPDLEAQVTRGHTQLLGQCVRVGGWPPHSRVQVRLSTGEQLNLKVTPDQAKLMGQHLYEDVIITGEAVWRLPNWEVAKVLLDESLDALRPTRLKDPVEVFTALAEAARGRWDGVDADEYVRKLREEDDDL